MYILSEGGREITLFRLFAGEVCILSASCLIKNISFDIYISCEEKSEVFMINHFVFSKLIEKNIYIENFSLKVAVDKFSKVMWTLQEILFLSFDKRLSKFLLDESEKGNSDTLKFTHEQIAKYLGSAREVVSRMLKYFSNENIVTLSRGYIKIIDKQKLEMLCKE